MWREYLKKGLEDFMEDVDSLLDKVFPYEKKFDKMGTKEYINYYHAKHRKIAARLLLYNAPVLPLIIFTPIETIANFIAYLSPNFPIIFLCLLLLCTGFFFVLARQIRGCILLFIGLLLFNSHILPYLELYSLSMLGVIFSFHNLCKLRTLQKYEDLAFAIEKSKLTLKTQEMDEARMNTVYKLKDDAPKFKGRED